MEADMCQITVDDTLIKEARSVTDHTRDEDIVQAASYIDDMKHLRKVLEEIEELQKDPGFVGWDPEFAGLPSQGCRTRLGRIIIRP
jgi:hypothetical protein